MTANHMGLEQTLSDERLEAMIGGLIMSKIVAQQTQSFTPSFAEQNDLQIAALRELLAYRKASKVAVADVVSWNKPGEERKCDIRWRRFDVAPGPLFTAPPLQAVTLPPEFHSEHGVVVQLEKVMAALAVHGIKYERRHQKVVGLRAGIDAVRAEGIDVDAEKINAEKYHK